MRQEIGYDRRQPRPFELSKLETSPTGKSIKQIHKDTDRDNYMSAEEACEYGIIDEVCRPN